MGNWRARLHGASLLRRYMTEAEFRTEASLYLPLGLNLLYALYKGAAGLYYRSAWFGSMALYYILLSAERFYLLHHVRDGRRDMGRQLRCYRFCGCLLLVSTAAILAMGFHTISGGHSIRYPGSMIYAAAAYTFYSLGAAAVSSRAAGGWTAPSARQARPSPWPPPWSPCFSSRRPCSRRLGTAPHGRPP